MSLKDSIDSTNTEKEKVKKVATQIDNKLVALGGQQATDLADVPNKMQDLTKQYSKIATGTLNQEMNQNYNYIELPIDFEAKRVFLKLEPPWQTNYNSEITVDTQKKNPYYYDYAEINKYNFTSGAETFQFWFTKNNGKKVEIKRDYATINLKAIAWIAIG